MNVTDETQKIAVFVAEIGFVAPLKKVANLSIFVVEMLSVGKIDHLHNARYRVIGCLNQEMNVITHEHISIKNKAALVPVSVQSLKVLAAIGLVKEDILSLITPDDDMVKSPLKLYTRFPCHALISNYIRLFA
jgi:hypothetical protein